MSALRSVVSVGLLFFRAIQVFPATPDNDLFADRTIIAGPEIIVTGDNSGAGLEPGEPGGGDSLVLLNSVWYSWTAPETGAVRVWVESSGFDCMVSLYRGEGVTELVNLAGPAGDTARFYLEGGDRIEIGVNSVYWPIWGGGGGSGPFTLHLEFSIPAPTSPNDRFGDALVIEALPYSMTGNLRGATREAGEPMGWYGDAGVETLWWSFASSETGIITVSAAAPLFRPRLVAYRGNSMDDLEYLDTSDGATVQVRAAPGQTNWFQLTTAFAAGAADEYTLEATFLPAPTNDDFNSSTQVEGDALNLRGWILDATIEPDEPLPTPSVTRTLWWSWAAPADGRVVVTPLWIVAQGGPSLLAIYTGPVVDRLIAVPVRAQGFPWTFAAQGGVIYHFQLWPHTEGTEPTGFDLAFHPFSPTTNDHFSAARLLEGGRTGSIESLVGATREPGEPAHRADGPNKSVWWRWNVSATSFEAEVRLGAGVIDSATIAVYQGASVDTLQLVAKGEDYVRFPVIASESYAIAVETPAALDGDVELICMVTQDPFFGTLHQAIPNNLVSNPSFETLGGSLFEGWSGTSGGMINNGGADGANFAMVGGDMLWQDVPTVPGQPYRLRFVHGTGQGYDAELKVTLNGTQVGIVKPSLFVGDWRTAEFEIVASNTVSRLGFQAGYLVNLDQVSLIWLNEPPQLRTPPVGVTAFAGAPAFFTAGVSGAEPLSRQWFHDGVPIAGATGHGLSLPTVTALDAGLYWIEATNAFGSVASTPVTLTVESPTSPQVVLHPQGDRAFEGQYVVLQTAATGSPPLHYQWYRDGIVLPGADQPTLILPHFSATDVGTYIVQVANGTETAASLPATLSLTADSVEGGGTIRFANMLSGDGQIIVPIYDVDGVTRLAGSNFAAQLYVGSTDDALRPVGEPRAFLTGFSHGLWEPASVILTTVPPGAPVFVQVRVWDRTVGASYEIARALGGRFGRSQVLSLIAGHSSVPPVPFEGAQLSGMQSFSLQAGLPRFTTGQLELAERLDGGLLVWRLTGAAGFRYLVERQTDETNWLPFTVLTNATGVVLFEDRAQEETDLQLYRARILD